MGLKRRRRRRGRGRKRRRRRRIAKRTHRQKSRGGNNGTRLRRKDKIRQ